ncbi:uncharacterized protein LOC132306446 [Cornus florida]|uniref:uncharacterized protein LOC132306446 n=1 Tax=Cornus florida TaxID=4283 RepID=UPI00289F522D|nr:uncharacterized protein LOC132306446 [Cornus florida]XP_059659822.1 uncharacterized protein LOC132306446 [Cornus florida]XP_059659829.1 uncharacterized protein LOC132306446 [Cornus florida]XP_059659836.1 uncharacterized protein LOC132306446 [Cornus florida]XP_059659842.1 uncharacterized protein LOC132306446 [Cornus florida]XP_059659850.1 uncharacterized protein LOC132306446 [Cornus florida]XP_059659854.1 uncharacterized protein LOC132306446 [Cornus florida]XP_059659861.1 uncharacterized p
MPPKLSQKAKGKGIASPPPIKKARTTLSIREPQEGSNVPRDEPSSPSFPTTEIPSGYPSVFDIVKVQFTSEHFYNDHTWQVYNKVYKNGPIKLERNVNLKKLRDSPGKKLVDYIEKHKWLFFTTMANSYSPDLFHYFYSNIRKVHDSGYFEVSLFEKDYVIHTDAIGKVLGILKNFSITGYRLPLDHSGLKWEDICNELCIPDSLRFSDYIPNRYLIDEAAFLNLFAISNLGYFGKNDVFSVDRAEVLYLLSIDAMIHLDSSIYGLMVAHYKNNTKKKSSPFPMIIMALYRHFEIPLPLRAHHIEIMAEMDVRAFNKAKSARASSRKASTGAAASSSSLLEVSTLFPTKQTFNTLDANLLYSLILQNQKALMNAVLDFQEDVRLLKEQRTGGTFEDVYRPTPPNPSLVAEDNRDEDDESDNDAEDDDSRSDTDGGDEDIPTSTIPCARDDPDA